MKTLTTLILATVISVGTAFSQPVKDKIILPVGITLNSVLRLDIVSGGAIEFVFNNLTDYNQGINPTGGNTLYQTQITVSSSTDWDLNLWSEGGFIGASGKTIDLDHLEYQITATGSHTDGVELTIPSSTNRIAVTNATVPVIIGNDGQSAGDDTQNAFIIDWFAGVTNTFLAKNYPADRYVANIILQLVAK